MAVNYRLPRTIIVAAVIFIIILGYVNQSYNSRLEAQKREYEEERRRGEDAIRAKDVRIDQLREEHSREIDLTEIEIKSLRKKVKYLSLPPKNADIRTQLALLFPYEKKSKFPAFIWQTRPTSGYSIPMEQKYKEYIKSWDDVINVGSNGRFMHEIFDDDQCFTIVSAMYAHVPDVVRTYELLPNSLMKADFFRYLILLVRGGIYADLDTEALKPVERWAPMSVNLRDVGLVVGVGADIDTKDWILWLGGQIIFANWVIHAKPGHPILREVVSRIVEKTLQLAAQKEVDLYKNKNVNNQRAYSGRENSLLLTLPQNKDTANHEIMKWTGVQMWTSVIFDYLNDEVKSNLYTPFTWQNVSGLTEPKLVSDILILPITSFSPGVRWMGAKDKNDPMALVDHKSKGLWSVIYGNSDELSIEAE